MANLSQSGSIGTNTWSALGTINFLSGSNKPFDGQLSGLYNGVPTDDLELDSCELGDWSCDISVKYDGLKIRVRINGIQLPNGNVMGTAQVPEPSSMWLVVPGVLGVLGSLRKKLTL